MGRLIKIGSNNGYLGRPAGDGPWPAMIVISEWWGLDNQTESVVDRFAGIGYLAFAPDLFDGELVPVGDHEGATRLSQKYGPGAPNRLAQTFDDLKQHAESNGRIGSTGFCFGGYMSLALGIRKPLDAICTFYGGGMQQLFDQLDKLKCPVLGLFGDQDRSIPPGTIEEFDKVLDRVGVEHKVIMYPNSGHAFFRDRDPKSYRPEAAADAWERVQDFFTQYLKSSPQGA